MYNTRAYGSMIADTVRMDTYTQALRAAVKPDDLVVDLGTGTGIFAMLACQFGAGKVIAIDPNENIQVAKRLAKDNGLLDHIDFIEGVSTKVHLPRKADVVISDLRGLLPLHGNHIPALMHARSHLLKPGGILIPKRDTLSVCIVEAPELYKDYSDPWDANPYKLDLHHAREVCLNSWSHGRVKADQILTQDSIWGRLEYLNIKSPNLQGTVEQRVIRPGMAYGLVIWFDAELLDGIGFSNAPESNQPTVVYGSAFFPFLHPVEVSENDEARIEIKAMLIKDEYTWCWNTSIVSDKKLLKADFQQSTFYGTIFSPENLRKRQPGYIPKLKSSGQIECFIQQEMDGINSVDAIAKKIFSRFPDQFSSFQEAIEKVGDSSQKYGN